MSIPSTITSILLQAEPAAGESSMSIDLAIWKWVIIIGVSAIIILYTVKRIADIAVKKKTDTMIKKIVGEETPRGEDWEDLEKMNKELDDKSSE